MAAKTFVNAPSTPLSNLSKLVTNTLHGIAVNMMLWISIINLCLIIITNPSLLNPGPVKNMSVLYQNVQGFVPICALNDINPNLNMTKLLEFQSYVYQHKPDIVVLNETWLKPSINNSEILDDKVYNSFRLDRSPYTHPQDPQNPHKYRKNGGGVLIAIREDLDVSSCKQINIKCHAEILSVEIKLPNGQKLIVCSFYRVGTLGIENYTKVEAYLQAVCKRRGVHSFLLLGDLNLHSVSWDLNSSASSVQQAFLDLFGNLGLSQLIKEPTHQKGKILDILLTDRTDDIANVSLIDQNQVCKSDHFPISLNIKTKVNRKKIPKREIYDYGKADWTKLNEEFSTVQWDSIFNDHTCIDRAWKKFKETLFSKVDKYVPKISIGGHPKPPWFDSDVFKLCNKKDGLRKKFKTSQSDSDYMAYSSCRSELKKLIKHKMRENFVDGQDSTTRINKKFWTYVKSSSNSTRIPESVYYNDCHGKNPTDQAKIFNKFFSDQFSDKSNYNVIIDDLNDPLYDIDFTVSEVSVFLRNINANKAQGPDGVHGRILKNCAATLSYPLAKLFSLSYASGRLPAEWKIANVVPVHKKGSRANVENYRPISLTSIVVKQYEKFVRAKLMSLCRDLITPNQHGFLPRKSCTTQMVEFTDSLAVSLNSNCRIDSIYFDFMKAFDSVNHDIILYKLKHSFNIDGKLLRFVKNYLQDRKQQVVISNQSSKCLDVLSGVPQGSIIGPILFVLFINDIDKEVSPGTNIVLYADDTKIWRVIESQADNLVLQKDIDSLHDWAVRNKMKFHPDKCHVLPITRKRLQPNFENEFEYKLNNDQIDYCHTEKDLGVHVTTKLSWTDHCNKLYSIATSRLGLIKRTCHFLQDLQRKRLLYLTMVRSHFLHCSIIWRPHNASSTAKIESVQKRAVKWILNEPYASYCDLVYSIKCKSLNILPLNWYLHLVDLTTLHSIVYNLSPIKLPSYLNLFSGNSRLRSSHLDHLSIVSDIVPQLLSQNTERLSDFQTFDSCFFHRTHTAWNRLPLELREIKFTNSFQINLIQHIWKEIFAIQIQESLESAVA